ncbi:hypothetical protein RVR_304 [Actinacidiphila reveromycinica]|uniref:Pycsar effector protein domain-containing protein n=1 Tax=Actinacidiphila reveromycinica TaxID=659352 RepID=A0A7U3UMU7_9ACTN|nr:Pycsar system effector family protein [Streptomyces sp. SN-593]BBA95448.1 hypothetical protein RVR_304 [Streptomyces sp. SN-593]
MPGASAQQQATESAWRLLGTLMDWTGKADTKAAVVLSLESAVATTLVVLSDGWPPPSAGRGAAALALCHWAGTALLVVSAAVCVLAVTPRLDGAAHSRRRSVDCVYFGHLRNWDPADLADALRAHDPLPALTRELVAVSRICWRKHRLLQVSIALACAGTVLAATGAV